MGLADSQSKETANYSLDILSIFYVLTFVFFLNPVEVEEKRLLVGKSLRKHKYEVSVYSFQEQ